MKDDDLSDDDELFRHIPAAAPPRKPTDPLDRDDRARILNAGKKGIVDLAYNYRGLGALTSAERDLMDRHGLRSRLEKIYYDMAYGDTDSRLLTYADSIADPVAAESVKGALGCLIAHRLILSVDATKLGGSSSVVGRVIPELDASLPPGEAQLGRDNVRAEVLSYYTQAATELKAQLTQALASHPDFTKTPMTKRRKACGAEVSQFQLALNAQLYVPPSLERPWKETSLYNAPGKLSPNEIARIEANPVLRRTVEETVSRSSVTRLGHYFLGYLAINADAMERILALETAVVGRTVLLNTGQGSGGERATLRKERDAAVAELSNELPSNVKNAKLQKALLESLQSPSKPNRISIHRLADSEDALLTEQQPRVKRRIEEIYNATTLGPLLPFLAHSPEQAEQLQNMLGNYIARALIEHHAAGAAKERHPIRKSHVEQSKFAYQYKLFEDLHALLGFDGKRTNFLISLCKTEVATEINRQQTAVQR